MSIKISYKKQINEKLIKNYVLFSDDGFKIHALNEMTLGNKASFIKEIIKKNESKKGNFLAFNINSIQRIILISLKKKTNSLENEKIGADFYNFIKSNSFFDLTLVEKNIKAARKNNSNILEEFLHGIELKSYEFNKYKSKKKNLLIKINISVSKKTSILNKNIKYKALVEGTNFARDLVSEPPNVLTPKEYVNRLIKLKRYGLKITVYNEVKLKKLKMFSLLGVGQGSINESFLVTIEWDGNKKNKSKPLSFVGKGVCFDTGGISLKPARFMEEMKYDMAGSAVVAGLLKNLAIRKSKINAVGVVGLVENMPGGNAQRPGDIVKSYSGKTIEVLNTDAEGRLVLADALSFTEKKFKPKSIIDLATLTGAIIMALGEEYAGLFSNNNELSSKIEKAGEKVGEKVWRLPLHENYDKLMNSPVADIQNINYVGGAGSITAAQFLQRFILNKTPWAHLDIAGMAFSKKAANLNPSGATGFGVRLLNKFIEENYE
jgi:leucyl aminopeptidase